MLKLVAILWLAVTATAFVQDARDERRTVLDAFFSAFNDHDTERMIDLVTEDVVVYYLGPRGVEGRVDGAEALEAQMRRYFSDIPSARSEILAVMEDGPRLAVRERASWTDSTGRARSQTALAVYRIHDDRIAAAWYFPAAPAGE